MTEHDEGCYRGDVGCLCGLDAANNDAAPYPYANEAEKAICDFYEARLAATAERADEAEAQLTVARLTLDAARNDLAIEVKERDGAEAALLVAQQERDERADKERRWRRATARWRVRAWDAEQKTREAEATITRLREALEHLERDGHEWFVNDDGSEGPHLLECTGCFARAALAQDAEQGPVPGSTFLPPDAPEPPPGTLLGGYSAQDAEQEQATKKYVDSRFRETQAHKPLPDAEQESA